MCTYLCKGQKGGWLFFPSAVPPWYSLLSVCSPYSDQPCVAGSSLLQPADFSKLSGNAVMLCFTKFSGQCLGCTSEQPTCVCWVSRKAQSTGVLWSSEMRLVYHVNKGGMEKPWASFHIETMVYLTITCLQQIRPD